MKEKTKEQLIDELSELRKRIAELEKHKAKHGQAKKRVNDRDAMMNSIFRAAPIGMGVILDRVIQFVNQKFIEMIGYSAEELIGQNSRMVYPSNEEFDRVGKYKYEQIRKYGTGTIETQLLRKDGRIIDVLLSSTLIDLNDLSKGVTFTAMDITERKQAEQELLKERTLLKAIVDGIPVLLTHYDPGTNMLYLNKEFEKIVGWKTEEVQNIDMMEKVYPDPDYRKKAAEYMQKASAEWKEFRVQSKSGKIIDSEWSNIRLDDGIQIGIGIDITERKRVEEDLEKNEQFLNSILESVQDGISVLNPDLTVRHVNGIMNKWYKENIPLEGKKCYEVYHNADKPCDPCPTLRCLESGKTEWNVVPGLQGSPIEWIELYSYPIKDSNSGKITGVVEFVRDITERKQVESALRKSEKKYRTLVNEINDGFFTIDKEGAITFANKALSEMLGYTEPKELYDKKFMDFRSSDDRGIGIDKLIKIIEGGSQIDLIEDSFIRKNEDKRYVQLKPNPIIEEGKVVGFSGVIRDVTEQKIAENKIRASLNEKEVMLREIHHRVKGNMQIISSFLRLQSQSIRDEDARKKFNVSRNRIKSMALIHDSLYRSDDLARIDFSDYVRKMTTHLLSIYSSIAAQVSFNIDIEKVYLDVNQAVPCGLIINELVSNSLKHAFPEERKGEIIVKMLANKHGKFNLVIKDTGVGFPEGLDINKTESLGMQVVTDLVRQLDGTIELDKKGGTTWKIKF